MAGLSEASTEATGTAAVRVLVVDDDPLVRTGLRLLLAGDPGIELVAEAEDGTEVVGAVGRSRPDVVLMDVRMPQLDGVAATLALRRLPDPPAIIMLTTFDADGTVLAAVRAGADGYLVKHAAPEDIVAAVHRAAAGEPVFSPSVLRALLRRAADRDGAGPAGAAPADPTRTRWARLSERERAVAHLVARGLSNAEVAAELYLSTGTVKAEISSTLAALGLTNRIQLAIVAHQQGESPPHPPHLPRQ